MEVFVGDQPPLIIGIPGNDEEKEKEHVKA
jgi:hypothetical protein